MTPLRSQQKALEELWKQGLSGHRLLHQYTDIADQFIVERFEQAVAKLNPRGEIAIIALGGYGRRELYPFSDIDLLLLHDRWSQKHIKELAEAVLYPLWDEGLDVGHSVRSVKDAVNFAQEDYIFQVALLDARLLGGSEKLFNELNTKYKKKIFEGRRSDFVVTMEQYRSERREKFGSHAYLLEPHIKEGKGGMRDIQAMLWVAKGVFGLEGLDAIEASAMMSSDDRQVFEASWDMLTKIRNRLHYLKRRKDDQLIFEFQEEMAEAFGYRKQSGMLAVEHFMRDVYSHLQTVAVVTDLFFEHVQEILGLAGEGQKEKQLERTIVSRNGSIRISKSDDLNNRPYLLMRLFLQAGRHDQPLHYRTRRIISTHLSLVDDQFRVSKRVSSIFFEILLGSKNVFTVLESMLVSGLLSLYIPEFTGVESLAQHDLYHIYTVDRHQLQAVAEVNKLRHEMADLYQSLPEPHLLYLAALLHDIGKGQQTDHSERGATMIELIAKRLHLDEKECETLAFLVRYHLFLPENALRRDISDQEFISQAAELIGDVDRLTMLYLLTIADSKATGPSAWSSWKSSLLSDLYLQVKTCLAATCHEEEIQMHSQEQEGVVWLRDQLRDQIVDPAELRIDINLLPADYLMAFSPENVLYHLQVHQEQAVRLKQQVLLFPSCEKSSWSLLIMTTDRAGLLAKLCGVLALHNLSVLAAQIFTWPDGTVVDVLEVTSSMSGEYDEQNWKGVEKDFNLAINYRLDIGTKLMSKQKPIGVGRARQVQQLENKVFIDNESSQQYTIIEVYGSDTYDGTMYQLTQSLADFSLDIHRARVATEVEQLIDIFYVTTTTGEKILNPNLLSRIEKALLGLVGVDESEDPLTC